MSTINTSGINTDYPKPGVNNNSQGFRDNFSAIKNNIITAAAEITDLQNNVVVKSPLNGTAVSNDMADTLISNALTRSFRASTFNLGNSLQGPVVVDVSKGDVQYGAITGDTTLSFTGWAVTGMQSNVELQLAVSNSAAAVYFPAQITSANCYGVTSLENYTETGGTGKVTIPAGVCQLDYRLSSVDCGTTITIEPYNRPRRSSQIRNRTPMPLGSLGDELGAVAVDANYIYVCTGTYNSTQANLTVSATYAGNLVNCVSTTSLNTNAPIVFSGNPAGTNIVANTVYYIKSIEDGANITISDTGYDGVAGNMVLLNAQSVSMNAISYNGTPIWKRVDLASVTGDELVTGNLTVNGIANFTNVGNIKIGGPGNINGYFLQTDGAGNLHWSGGTVVAGSLSPGGSNTQIQYNAGNGNFAGTTGFTFNSATSAMAVPGTITTTGNITSGNVLSATTLSISSNATVSGNIILVRNLTGSANISATGTVSAGNFFTLGNAVVTGNVNAGYFNGPTYGDHEGTVGVSTPASGAFTTVTTSSTIVATGNVTAGNISTAGNTNAANVIASNYVIVGVNNAITAVGTNQGTAASLNQSINIVTSAAASTGAILPVAQAGMRIIVRNAAANAISVYPNLNATIGANAANVAYALPINTSVEYFCSTSAVTGLGGAWFTI